MSEHFNQLTPAEAERIALLMEECGEVIQICGKILRHGYNSSHPEAHPDDTNRCHLEKEIGDVHAALILMSAAGDVLDHDIHQNTQIKLRKVRKYLHHQGEDNE